MPTLSPKENRLVSQLIKEFAQHGPAGEVSRYECVYRSHDFGDTRFLLRLATANGDYALKIDTTSPQTGRLQGEFDFLNQLATYFRSFKASGVVQPVYMSTNKAFFVTEYVDRPTAADVIHSSPDDDRVAQIYRRAGEWLNDLHNYQPVKEYGFRPKWMTDSIQELTQTVPLPIQQESRAMLDELQADIPRLKGIPETQVFSHGDFHAQNLIVGQGQMIGLDFTEARTKLAVYDIVDFLKSDVFRDGASDSVDRSGILKTNKEMFFRRYRHPVHMGILDFCIRGRLLKDWLALWQIDHTCSPYETDKRTRLGQRLRSAFQISGPD